MVAETRALIERCGGRGTVAPSMREVPLEDNQAALDWASHVLKDEFDCAIFLTGVGTRELFRVIASRYTQGDVVAALKRITTVARGPAGRGDARTGVRADDRGAGAEYMA